jgi:site-specific DNA recombinase
LSAEQSATRTAKEQELGKITRDLDRLVNAITAAVDPLTLKDRLSKLEARKADLETTLARPEPHAVRLPPNLPKLYAEKVANLETALNDPAIMSEAADALRSMIDRIELHPRPDAPGLDALIYGDLAQILGICDDEGQIQQHPAVAAAGCQLCDLRDR